MTTKKAYFRVLDSQRKKYLDFEVEVMEHVKAYGRDMSVIRPIKGEGHIRVNSDKIIIR